MAGRAAPVLAGGLVLALLLLAHALAPESWRTRMLDVLLAADALLGRPAAQTPLFEVVVVDIDRESLEEIGPWPWPRLTIAGLVDAVVELEPAALGIDILFAEPDQRSPAALARQLAEVSGRDDLQALAASLPDGDAELARAIGALPAALGFVLDPEGRSSLPGAPFLTVGRPDLRAIWQSDGAVGPAPVLLQAASGLGTLSLPGGTDGIVREVPLLVAAGPTVLPGLAVETLRLAAGAPMFRLDAGREEETLLEAGGQRIVLPKSAVLRLTPGSPAKVVPALDLLRGERPDLAGRIVLLGGSAPELGGLRGTPFDPLVPSVQIQARALAQLMDGQVLRDAPAWRWLEPGGSLMLGGLALLAALVLGPAAGALVLGAACLAWIGGALALLRHTDRLLDPAAPPLVAALVFAVTGLGAFALTRQREQRLRESFGQRLHPFMVERLARQPDRLKLAGERRRVTVLVTDLENFTGLTHRIEPQELIVILDRYLEGISKIVVAHGGMIDKLVGDSVHAIFNAPVDLPDHASRALDAAEAIVAWTEAFRQEGEVAAHRVGRTRIGVESGLVIVGDVGIGTRLDYTAYGDAVNLAVRLEGQNKQLGTTILLGPKAAALVTPGRLRPVGQVRIRGRDEPLELFTLAGVT
ncbi:CHASE2 domain-containing protein [Geminicoccus roseus]|uniref:CHASE2 domain-containing protein n=1 Tax=Geminicoccus roseus TaxID=404900 RepID=UPI0003FACEC8|nr:adenylate/guanylate cyclase domain-containing protein [Geminicoccus roseus]